MSLFKGTCICQFNVDISVIAENREKAEEEMSERIDTDLQHEISVDGKGLTELLLNYDECFEIVDIEKIR